MFNNELEKQSDRIASQIVRCNSISDLQAIEKNYTPINHPHVGYKLGETFLYYDSKSSAFDHLIHSASYGITNDNQWINTGYSNSIGHSFYYLLTKYDYNSNLNTILSKMYANAYLYLGVCISNMAENAYDSCRTRAKLVDKYNGQCGLQIIKRYYYDGSDLCKEILSLGDYYLASIGLENNNFYNDSRICFETANNNFTKLKSLSQYQSAKNIELGQFSTISRQNSSYFFENLVKAYNNGDFNISKNDWQKIEMSQKPKTGLFKWF